MKKVLYTLNEVISLINQDKYLLLAGDEELLKKLPKGNWIGGTIDYFMAENGGIKSSDLIQVSEIPSFVKNIACKSYDIATIKNIYRDGFENGFSVVIIPSSSETHLSFAINAPDFKDFAAKPLIGWIAGVMLEDLGKKTAKTFHGSSQSMSEKDAVCMHVELPSDKYAEINILNLFTPGNGDTIEFPESGFQASKALINGQMQNFLDYVTHHNLDIRMPLVANYSGTMINISFQNLNKETNTVNFYAPVFKGITYKHAAPVTDYISQFIEQIPKNENQDNLFACNCILNYLYSELEGKKTGNITGPMTFGEIAYQLLNQTMVNLTIHDI